MVQRLRRDYQIKTRYDRLREEGLLTLDETAALLGVSSRTIKIWCQRGLLCARAYNVSFRQACVNSSGRSGTV